MNKKTIKLLVPEEQTSEVDEPKLRNSSSDEHSLPPGGSDRRTLTGGGGGTIVKRNFSKSKDARSDFSMMSCLRADSDSENPFFLRNSKTASTSETAMNARVQRRVRRQRGRKM